MSERPGGPIIDMIRREASIQFHPNWDTELPPPNTREELMEQLSTMFQKHELTPDQIKEALDYFEAYENLCYEMMGEAPLCYHRPCGGGALIENEGDLICAKCGRLPELLFPVFMR